MRATLLLIVILACSALVARGEPTGLTSAGHLQRVGDETGDGFSFTRLDAGVQLHVNGVTKNILFYGPTTVRVNANLGESYTDQPSLSVVTTPAPVNFTVEQTDDALTIVSDRLRIVADTTSGALTFYDAEGKLYTRERATEPMQIEKRIISDAPTYEVSQTFTLEPDESLYGLGQYNRPYMDYRGQGVLLVQTNIGIVIPLMVSTNRYGIMWDIYSKMTFKDDADGATLWAESAPAGMDYYFIGGDDLDEVIAGYRTLTGPAPMIPKQAFGFFMSKERYHTQERIVEVTKRFREENFPLDYIVQDWQYWGGDKDGTWSGMIWNEERYPDPEGMIQQIHDQNAKLMISIWPSVGNDTELAKELDEHGLRFEPLHWISRRARVYDAFSELGREIYFKHIKSGLLDKGVDALWMDGTEVEVRGACHDPGGVERDIKELGTNAMGDFTRYLNPYTLLTTRGTYEGQRATSDKRVFTLTRSAWTGAQRYSAVSWSGDTTAGWDTLRTQIAGGLNVCMAGQPYWTQDIGGFFVNYPGGNTNPEYQELFARWNQFGVFNPIYRVHGTSIDREPYLFKERNPEIYDSLLSAAHLRYTLLPYIYSLGWQSTSNGYTMMRALPMDFPDDMSVRKTDDAFMFGPALLVHPITRAMYHPGNPPAGTIPADVLRTPEGAPGLAVQYFKGMNFETPAGSAIDATVDHTWPGPPLADPPPGVEGFDNFSARWEGTLTAPEAGEYEIGVEGDDGFRLFLDGERVVQDWTHAPKRYRSTNVTLEKGQVVAVKVEYFQGGLDRAVRFAWRTPADRRAQADAEKVIDNTMQTYLPAGADWYDFWTNRRHAGGTTVAKDCPLNLLPIYVRAGSILPMGPVMEYATEKPDAPYEIRIYPGADAQFTIYEDDNETYAYEQGAYATYTLTWDDAGQTLSIGPRQGAFPELVKTRELKISLMGPSDNADNAAAELTREMRYDGQPVRISFQP